MIQGKAVARVVVQSIVAFVVNTSVVWFLYWLERWAFRDGGAEAMPFFVRTIPFYAFAFALAFFLFSFSLRRSDGVSA